MPTAPHVGPLTEADLKALWKSATDPGYSRGLEEAGDGRGLEVVGQALAQHARASLAVDRTTQALYLRRWSGQSDEPAGGARKARVRVAVTRSSDFDRAVVFEPGTGLEELTTDVGEHAPAEVLPGRRFLLAELLVFVPGEAGPLEAVFEAEVAGESFNDVPAGEVRAWVVPGVDYSNDQASVVPGAETHRLDSWNQPEVVVPGHVGQYVELTAGANAGQIRRAVGYLPPDLAHSPPIGGSLVLAPTGTYRVASVVGTFVVGEEIEGSVSLGRARVLAQRGGYLVADRTTAASLAAGDALTGATSGATCSVTAVEESPGMTAESQAATWRVPGWAALGFSAASVEQPTGGRSPMLDELGEERVVRRASGEDDEAYRRRLEAAPDVVTPKALLRAANRVLAPYGLSARLYEASQPGLLGLHLDGGGHLDVGLVRLLGPVAGAFFEGEEVVQEQASGGLARGRASMTQPAPASPGDPLPARAFSGVVATYGTFVTGEDAVGQASGATCSVTTVISTRTPDDRQRVLLSYADFRAFLLLGVPAAQLGEYGLAYDVGELGAYDAGPPASGAYDGDAEITARLRRAASQAVSRAKAGGVGFDLVVY